MPAKPPFIDMAIMVAAISGSFLTLVSLATLTKTGFLVSRSMTSITPFAKSILFTVTAMLRKAPLMSWSAL